MCKGLDYASEESACNRARSSAAAGSSSIPVQWGVTNNDSLSILNSCCSSTSDSVEDVMPFVSILVTFHWLPSILREWRNLIA